jgi:hypothetical protein
MLSICDFSYFCNMNKRIILPTSYLPPIQYFSKLLMYDEVIIDPMEHFQKQSFRNRCTIYGANGVLSLTVPLLHNHTENTAVKDMQIANDFDWQKIHWRSLESAYRCSPFFEYYEDYFMEFYVAKYDSLLHFNTELLHKIIELLGIKVNITNALEYISDYGDQVDDLRKSIHPKQKNTKPDKYFKPVRYIQVFENKYGFKENLSIIDLLFCEGRHALDVLKESIIQ